MFQEKEESAATAKMLLKELRSDAKYADVMEHSERTSNFRIKVSDLSMFPPIVEKALRNRKINTAGLFRGQKARVCPKSVKKNISYPICVADS